MKELYSLEINNHANQKVKLTVFENSEVFSPVSRAIAVPEKEHLLRVEIVDGKEVQIVREEIIEYMNIDSGVGI
jgi:hypothetical protein